MGFAAAAWERLKDEGCIQACPSYPYKGSAGGELIGAWADRVFLYMQFSHLMRNQLFHSGR